MRSSQKAYLSPQKIEERFGVPRGTLANLRCQKRGAKYYRRGRCILYREDEFINWLEAEPVLTIDSIENK